MPMKNLLILLLLLGIHQSAFSQLEPYQWRLGISGGYTNYYGDLSPYPISSIRDYGNFFRLFDYNENYVHDYSYALSLERRLSASLSLRLATGKYSISMSDRYISPSNRLRLDAQNFDRALNFKTEIRDYGLGLVLKPDNGRLLKKDAFFAPYLTFGMGWLNFKVFGDLYDQNNNPYDYSSYDPVNDGIFETRLDKLSTELPEGYSNTSFYSNVGLGIRFRLGKQLELFAQSDFKHAFTDYLDDVSSLYRERYDTPAQQYAARPGVVAIDWGNPVRGNNDDRKDWYIYHSIGVKFSFSPMKTAFRASRISPGIYSPIEDIPAQTNKPSEPLDSLVSMDQTMGVTNNHFTFIQLHRPYNRDSSYYAFKILEADVLILNFENQLLNNKSLRDSLYTRLDSLQSMRQRIELDTSNNDVKTSLLLTADKEIGEVESQLEEALLTKTEIDAGLMAARQNKELYQNAYRLSLERQDQSDSLGFVNEIMGLPDTIRKALTEQGSFYQINQDTAKNLQSFSSSNARLGRTSEGDDQDFRTFKEDERRGIYPDQKTQTYEELLTQERARNNYLLRELEYYSDRYFQSINQGVAKEEEQSNYSGRRNESGSDIYRIDDRNRFERRNRNPTYIYPIIVPDYDNRNPVMPEQEHKSLYLNEAPWQPHISPGLPRFRYPRPSSYFPEVTRKKDLNSKEIAVETKKDSVDTASAKKNIYHPPINSKIEIYFDNDQENPGEQELMKLEPLALMATNNPTVEITISGFADNTGRLRYNLNLINERTSNVKNFLVEKFGISPQRINILSGGLIVRENAQKPSPSDRRVEVWIRDKNRETPQDRGSINE
jgi:outer membrane protein OmpA-like peptidoglycan-associated protein